MDRPIEAGDRDRFAQFLRALGFTGINIGVREAIAVEQLFQAATARGIALDYTGHMVTSLLARNAADQTVIAAAFRQAFDAAVKIAVEVPEVPPEPWTKRLKRLLYELDAAKLAAALSVVIALGVAAYVFPWQQWGQVVAVPEPVKKGAVLVDNPVADSQVPANAGKPTWRDLSNDIVRLLAAGAISPMPTLTELQRAGWPPQRITGGIQLSLPDLARRINLDPNLPVSLLAPDLDLEQRADTFFPEFGLASAGSSRQGGLSFQLSFLTQFLDGLIASSAGDGTVLSDLRAAALLPRAERVSAFLARLDQQSLANFTALQAAVAGVHDQTEAADRLLFVLLTSDIGGVPALVPGFADASWRPAPPPAVRLAPVWLRPLATALPFLALALWLGAWVLRRTAYLETFALEAPKNPLDQIAIIAAPREILDQRTDKAWMARMVRKLHVRQHVADIGLDAVRTISATLRQGGLFVPVPGRVTTAPAYLVLIEARNGLDQEARRLEALWQRLVDAGLEAQRYFFLGNPAQLRQGWGAPAETLESIASQHNDRRLIILGEGRSFLTPFDLEPTPAARLFAQWPERAMLTPKPVADWGALEYALARNLGLPLGRATVEGLLALAELLDLEARGDPPYARAYGFTGGFDLPAMAPLLASRGQSLVSEIDPDQGNPQTPQWLKLEAALAGMLDRPGLVWLQALAIYPALQWDLTIWLGRKLTWNGEELYAEPRLAALTRLPWLREGHMPKWLRAHLIASLPEGARQQAVSLIWQVLGSAPADGVPNPVRLVHQAGRDPKIDLLFRRTLLHAGALRATVPSWRRLWQLAQAQWPALAMAVIAAATAWKVTPAPGDGALAPGGFMPVTLLFAIPVLAGAVWLALGHLRKAAP